MWRELHHLYNGSSGTFLPVKEGNDAMATVKFDQATRIYPGNDSPSVDRLDIDVADGEFLVLLSGVEETFAQRVHARSSYKCDEIVWDAKFSDILHHPRGNEVMTMDIGRLDFIEPSA